MQVAPSSIFPSPAKHGRVRYQTTVQYDNGWDSEEFWFDFPDAYAAEIAPSGNPWLALLLVAAAQLGEPLRIADPVDPLLLEGGFENLRIWKTWDRTLKTPDIEAPIRTAPPVHQAERAAAFFSGGVDSFYTVLSHDRYGAYLRRIDELISVWGFDIPFDSEAEIRAARLSLDEAARELNRPRIDVWTNIRTTRLREWEWGRFTHGGALAAVALALESRFNRCCIGSSYTVDNLHPWGSHPITDPNFSTLAMRLTHDAGAVSRVEKVGLIKDFPAATNHLRACWINQAAGNCSECPRCLRTMMAFDCYGALGRCKTFDISKYSYDRIRTMRAVDEESIVDFQRIYVNNLPPEANPEIRRALEEAIRENQVYYKRLRRLERLERVPYVGWLFGYYKRAHFPKNGTR